MRREFVNDYVKFEEVGSVIKGTFRVKTVSLEVAKLIVEERIKFSMEKSRLLLITDVGVRSIDREARSYFSSDEGIRCITASAILTKTPLGKHLANFFLQITVGKQKIPSRVFTDESAAINWLESHNAATHQEINEIVD